MGRVCRPAVTRPTKHQSCPQLSSFHSSTAILATTLDTHNVTSLSLGPLNAPGILPSLQQVCAREPFAPQEPRSGLKRCPYLQRVDLIGLDRPSFEVLRLSLHSKRRLCLLLDLLGPARLHASTHSLCAKVTVAIMLKLRGLIVQCARACVCAGVCVRTPVCVRAWGGGKLPNGLDKRIPQVSRHIPVPPVCGRIGNRGTSWTSNLAVHLFCATQCLHAPSKGSCHTTADVCNPPYLAYGV